MNGAEIIELRARLDEAKIEKVETITITVELLARMLAPFGADYDRAMAGR